MTLPTLAETQKHLKHFWEEPLSPEPLGLFRILISGFALLQAFLWLPDWLAFFGPDAWIQWEISKALNAAWHIHIREVYLLLHAAFGLTETQAVMAFFWFYVLSASGLLLGLYTRFWAFLTWLGHFIIMSSIPSFIYGVDIFLHIALFYLILMPSNKAYSLDRRLGIASGLPSWGVTLSLRVLQVHMCLVYLSAGYEKMLAPDWWNGNVLWRSLVQPDFRQYDLTWLAKFPWITMLLSWFTMLIETGYCIGMWIPKVRVFWLLGIISLHVGIMVFLGLGLFGTIMILLSISAFGFAAWKDVQRWIRKDRQLDSIPDFELDRASG